MHRHKLWTQCLAQGQWHTEIKPVTFSLLDKSLYLLITQINDFIITWSWFFLVWWRNACFIFCKSCQVLEVYFLLLRILWKQRFSPADHTGSSSPRSEAFNPREPARRPREWLRGGNIKHLFQQSSWEMWSPWTARWMSLVSRLRTRENNECSLISQSHTHTSQTTVWLFLADREINLSGKN